MKTERNILIAFLLNLAFSIFEFVGGALTGSIAIISDAIHDIGDAFSIGLSFAFERVSRKKPNKTYTYGYYRYSVLGGAIQSAVLLWGSGLVLYNAVLRFIDPTPIDYSGMIIIAIIGFAVNFAAAWFTSGEGSVNQRAINLHMLEDVLGWAIVLVGAVVMRFTDWWFLDPALSVGLALFIGWHALKNLKTVADIFLEKTPNGMDTAQLQAHLQEIHGVQEIHHLHIWSMDGNSSGATLHAVIEGDSAHIKAHIRQELAEHGITHATIECEHPGETCPEKHCRPARPISHGHHHHH